MEQEIVIFGIKFKKFVVVMLAVFITLALQSGIKIGFLFFTGPMGWMVFLDI